MLSWTQLQDCIRCCFHPPLSDYIFFFIRVIQSLNHTSSTANTTPAPKSPQTLRIISMHLKSLLVLALTSISSVKVGPSLSTTPPSYEKLIRTCRPHQTGGITSQVVSTKPPLTPASKCNLSSIPHVPHSPPISSNTILTFLQFLRDSHCPPGFLLLYHLLPLQRGSFHPLLSIRRIHLPDCYIRCRCNIDCLKPRE